MNKALAGLALLLGTGCLLPVARAAGIDLSLSNETANLAILINPRQLYEGSGSELAIGGFVSEDDDRLLHVSLMARGYRPTAQSGYALAAGIKVVGGDVAVEPERVVAGGEDSERVGAVALGLQADFPVFGSPRNPVDFGLEAFFAPSIASFSDAEQFSEFGLRLQIEIIPTAHAYVGYRRMGFDTNDYDDLRLDRGVHVGLKITF